MNNTDETDSLISALNKAGIPSGNHDYIRRIVNGVGVDSVHARPDASKPHVIAKRRDGGLDLHIYHGYTERLASEAEISRILGPGATMHPADSPKGTWWVAHPINKIYEGSERAKNRGRQAGFCSCGMQLSLTGSCDSCD